MGFAEIVRIWRRRARLTAALVVIAIAGFAAVFAWFPSTYQSQGSVVLLASRSASRQTGGNPYLSFTPSLSLTADVVSRALMAPATASYLARRGYIGSYTVAPPTYSTTTTGSVLVATVTGHDQAGVERTLRAVIAHVRLALAQIQGRLQPRNRITIAVLALSPRAVLAASSTARPVVMTLIIGLLAALGIPVLLDGVRRRRAITRPAPTPGNRDRVGQLADGWSSIGVS